MSGSNTGSKRKRMSREQRQEQIYSILLSLTEATAYEIARRAGCTSRQVYTVMEQLHGMGLVIGESVPHRGAIGHKWVFRAVHHDDA